MSGQRSVSRRRFLILGTGVAGGAVLAACQQAPPPTPQVVERVVEKPVEKVVTQVVEKPVEKVVTQVVERQVQVTAVPKSREVVEIIFDSDWVAHEGGSRPDVIRQALDLWHQNNKTRVIARNDGVNQKTVAANTFGDVVLGGGTPVIWAEQGIFHDITPVLQAKKYDWSDFIKHEQFYMYKGKYIGLPFQFNIFDWVANKQLIESAGLSVPDSTKWTWNDVLEIGQKITKPDKNIWGNEMRWGVGSTTTWMTAIWAFGGDLMNKEGTKTLLDQGPAVEAFQMIVDWIHRWKIQPTAKQLEANKLGYGNGNYAFSIGVARNLPTAKFPSVQMLPPIAEKTGQRSSQMNAQPHWITRNAARRDNVEQAVDFAAFMASPEVQKLIIKLGGSAPMRISSFETDDYAPKQSREVILESNKYREGLLHERTKYWGAWWGAIQKPLQAALDGEISAKEGLTQATQLGDKALAGQS